MIFKVARNTLRTSMPLIRSLQYSAARNGSTTTLSYNNTTNKIETVRIETSITPVESDCTPSNSEKIYPTSMDDYDSVPIMIDGKPYVVDIQEMCHYYPPIPSFERVLEGDNSEKSVQAIEGDQADQSSGSLSIVDLMNVNFAENMPTIHDDKKPERDNVNFPRIVPEVVSPPTRMIIFPKKTFDAFYEKTGVTGPYTLVVGFTSFLVSKEYLVIEEEFAMGFGFLSLVGILLKKFGREIENLSIAVKLKERQGWLDWQEGSVKFLNNYIEMCKQDIGETKALPMIFDAKRENIHFQLEAEYRRRQMAVYNEVKRKLDYQVAINDVKRQFAQRHMIDWIINQVNKSVNADLKKTALSRCLADLKDLAARKPACI